MDSEVSGSGDSQPTAADNMEESVRRRVYQAFVGGEPSEPIGGFYAEIRSTVLTQCVCTVLFS